jgi:preprotein translocase subunit SecG
MTFFLYLTLILFIVVCLFLILLVLIQKGRGGGLASAFGGGGGNTAFGSKTGDVLTWATSIVFGVFLVLGIALNLLANNYNARQRAGAVPAGVTTPAPQQGPGGPTAPAKGGDTSLPQPIPSEPGSPGKAPEPGEVPVAPNSK